MVSFSDRTQMESYPRKCYALMSPLHLLVGGVRPIYLVLWIFSEVLFSVISTSLLVKDTFSFLILPLPYPQFIAQNLLSSCVLLLFTWYTNAIHHMLLFQLHTPLRLLACLHSSHRKSSKIVTYFFLRCSVNDDNSNYRIIRQYGSK